MVIDSMRRSFRGSRRRNGPPRGMNRSAKYIIVSGPASAAAGTEAVTMVNAQDNATLGQTSVTDAGVPVGAKITSFEIFMPKVNLGAATANFITWSIQRLLTGQAVVNPITASGAPLRKNIMLTGVVGLGAGQNNSLHIKFRVPPKFQRMGDGDQWVIVNNNDLAVSVTYYIIYKVWM